MVRETWLLVVVDNGTGDARRAFGPLLPTHQLTAQANSNVHNRQARCMYWGSVTSQRSAGLKSWDWRGRRK